MTETCFACKHDHKTATSDDVCMQYIPEDTALSGLVALGFVILMVHDHKTATSDGVCMQYIPEDMALCGCEDFVTEEQWIHSHARLPREN